MASNEWYTPAKYIALARQVLGRIDVDPASCAFANETVRATRFFTEADDGLQHDWLGNVWCNPPYSRGCIDRFVVKMIEEVNADHTTAGILLAHSYVDSAWFHAAAAHADAMCMTRGRIRFVDADGKIGPQPTHGSVFFYWGTHPEQFIDVFRNIGLALPLN